MTTKPYHCQHCGKPVDFEDNEPHEDIGGPDAFSWVHAACAKAWHEANDKPITARELREHRAYEDYKAEKYAREYGDN